MVKKVQDTDSDQSLTSAPQEGKSFDLYIVQYIVRALMLLIVLSFSINDLMSISGTPDKWDWLHAAKLQGGIMLMFIMIFSGIMLITEVIALLTRKYSAASARFVFTRQMLVQARQRNGKDPFVQEVN